VKVFFMDKKNIIPGISPPMTRQYLMGFLLLHGLFFLGVGYIFAQMMPVFMIFHSGFGIFVYLVFLRTGFPKIFRSAAYGAVVSVVLGLIAGDFLLSNFFFLIDEPTFLHRVYAIIVVFYIYVYVALLRQVFNGSRSS
jgi:hypothetical protein